MSNRLRRLEIAQLFSPLKRVRPRVPFFRLAEHVLPTRWDLYRKLLRYASSDDIRWKVKGLFRRNQYLTSPEKTRVELERGYKWLDVFTKAREGDVRSQRVLRRFSSLIAVRRAKDEWKAIYRREIEWIQKLQKRPILTGAYHRATYYNRPLPRMKPQPIHVTMMIKKRMAARWNRHAKTELWKEWKEDIKRERSFEQSLFEREGPVFQPEYTTREWEEPINQLLHGLQRSFALDEQRATTPFPPELLAQIKEARREKIRNKTKERQRQLHGEVLPATRKRRAKGLPSHLLSTMSQKTKAKSTIVREISRGGYSGWVKTGEWGENELGPESKRAELDSLAEKVRVENENRRIKAEVDTQR